nr:hypothetical protein [Bacteroidota bacterium]
MFTNSTILEPLFWIIMGVLYTIFAISMTYWARDLKLKMNWWKWLLSIIWFILLNITIAGGFTLIEENESRAGIYFIGIFGTILIVLGVGLWQLFKS